MAVSPGSVDFDWEIGRLLHNLFHYGTAIYRVLGCSKYRLSKDSAMKEIVREIKLYRKELRDGEMLTAKALKRREVEIRASLERRIGEYVWLGVPHKNPVFSLFLGGISIANAVEELRKHQHRASMELLEKLGLVDLWLGEEIQLVQKLNLIRQLDQAEYYLEVNTLTPTEKLRLIDLLELVEKPVHVEKLVHIEKLTVAKKLQFLEHLGLIEGIDIETRLPSFGFAMPTAVKKLGFKDMQRRVEKSKIEVQRHLSLGWIGLCDFLPEEDLNMGKLMDLWGQFHQLLVLLQSFLFVLDRILRLRAKIPYLILFYFSFSEYPNRLRPPCTTMPWTIWPALVVLWGVCWMFYDHLDGPLGDQDGFTPIDISWDFEDTDPFLGLDLGFNDMINGMSTSNALDFDPINFEQPSHLMAPDLGTMAGLGSHQDYTPSLTMGSLMSTTDPMAIRHGNDSLLDTMGVGSSAVNGEQGPSQAQQEETTSTDTNSDIISSVTGRPGGGETRSSRSSRHGQTEKYFCPYPDCKHSQPGSGFKRKDHLNQHLRGPHKETIVPRMRAKPTATASGSSNPTVLSAITSNSLQSQKRKREDEDDRRRSTVEELREQLEALRKELMEERELRLLVEKENRSLRQKGEVLERREKRMRNGSTGYT